MAEKVGEHQELTPNEARQGVKSNRVSKVLIISTLTAALALGVVVMIVGR